MKLRRCCWQLSICCNYIYAINIILITISWIFIIWSTIVGNSIIRNYKWRRICSCQTKCKLITIWIKYILRYIYGFRVIGIFLVFKCNSPKNPFRGFIYIWYIYNNSLACIINTIIGDYIYWITIFTFKIRIWFKAQNSWWGNLDWISIRSAEWER